MNESLISCRTCGSKNQHEYFSTKDWNQEKSDDSFQYYRCYDCRSIFLYPIPKNLGLFYSQSYPAYSVKNSEDVENNFNYLEQAKLNIVKKYSPSGKLVEIGPAVGRFLSVASRSGYQVIGIEQDAGCVEHIRSTLNLEVTCSDNPTDKLLQLEASCDVIVAWHVIEHLQDLRGIVSAVSKALRKPNGIFVVSAPNPDAWSFKIFGRYWVHLDAPRHLTLIPLKALDKLMADHGLERVVCIFDDPVGLQLNRMGWINSMMNLGRTKNARLWLSRVMRVLSIGMVLLDRTPGRGAAYTAIYKKGEM